VKRRFKSLIVTAAVALPLVGAAILYGSHYVVETFGLPETAVTYVWFCFYTWVLFVGPILIGVAWLGRILAQFPEYSPLRALGYASVVQFGAGIPLIATSPARILVHLFVDDVLPWAIHPPVFILIIGTVLASWAYWLRDREDTKTQGYRLRAGCFGVTLFPVFLSGVICVSFFAMMLPYLA